jgi:hypothetical protein
MANVGHDWFYECALFAMRKILELSSDCGDPGRKKRKRDNVGGLQHTQL